MFTQYHRTLLAGTLSLSLSAASFVGAFSLPSAYATEEYMACGQIHPEDYAPKAKLILQRHKNAHFEIPCRLASGAVVMNLLNFSYDKDGQLNNSQTLIADTGVRTHLKNFWSTTLGRLSMGAGVLAFIYYLRKGGGLRRRFFRSQADLPEHVNLANAVSDLQVGDKIIGENTSLLVVGHNESIVF